MKLETLKWRFDAAVNGRRILRAIERAGRTCYKSHEKITDNSAEAFARMLVQRGHLSVLEHQSITIWAQVNRGLSHEIVRHRIAAYSQESTRYCSYVKERFGSEIALIPMMDGLTPEQIDRRLYLYDQMESVYLAELAEGVKPQQARDNLPICLKTEIKITYNLRQWRHFFALRTAKAAHPQMRQLTIPMLARFREKIPVVFNDISKEIDTEQDAQKRLARDTST